MLPAGVVPPPQYPVPTQAPTEEEGGAPVVEEQEDKQGEDEAPQGGSDEAGKADTGAAAAERGLKKLQG